MNAKQLHHARLEAVGPEVAAQAFELAARVTDQHLTEGMPAEDAVRLGEAAGNRVLDAALVPHQQEILLVWRKEDGGLLPTGAHRRVSRQAKRLGPEYLHALGVQVHRQAVALNCGITREVENG